MKSALISLGSKSSMMIAEAMKKYFEKVEEIDIRKLEVNLGSKLDVLYDGKELGNLNCIYCRGSFRYVPLLRSVTLALWNKSYMPIKPAAFSIGHDKLITHLVLQQNKIPMPKTYLTSSAGAARKLLEKLNYPIIMKFPSGTGGKGVMYAESFGAASSMMDALETLKQPFIIQEYVETGGTDIRAIVVGDKIVASMKRIAEFGEKRANIHAGGEGEPFILDAHSKKIALETAKAIGAEICAVDILEGIKGPMVIETNLSPGIQGITQATGIDVADKIAKFLYEKTKDLVDKKKGVDASQIMQEIGLPEAKQKQQIITNLDIRGGRVLLPKIVTEISKFDEKEEFVINVEKGVVKIDKFKISNK